MSPVRYFVFPCGDQWMVTLDGTAVGRHARQQDALQSAIVMADLMGSMRHDADVMLEEEGQLDLVWSYGSDVPEESAQRAAR